jgi:hypothetical protein
MKFRFLATAIALSLSTCLLSPVPAQTLRLPTGGEDTIEPPQAKNVLTFQQIEDLTSALRAVDAGSADQCTEAPKPATSPPAALATPPPRSCPFHKSPSLLRAMAQDMVALQPLDAEFKIRQNAVRLEVLDESKLTTAQQDAKFLAKMAPITAEKRTLPLLARIKMAELNLGDPPDHNRIPAMWIAALSPIIDDLTP